MAAAGQIAPVAPTRAFAAPDRVAAERAFDAMMAIQKVDVVAIEAANRGYTRTPR